MSVSSSRPVYNPPRNQYDHFPDPRVVYIYPELEVYSVSTGIKHDVIQYEDGRWKIDYNVPENDTASHTEHQFRLYVNGEDSGLIVTIETAPGVIPRYLNGDILLNGLQNLSGY